MEIDFYTTFAKRINSTKQPSGSATRTLTGVLREPCSIMNPSLKIERLPADSCPESYIYAFIPAFQRYYFVKDWTWVDGLWQVNMEVDVLGSWKTYIGAMNEYVLRTDSETSDFDGAICDRMYPATTDFSITQLAFTNPFETNIHNGAYVVGIISGSNVNTSVGAITYYAMTELQFSYLKYKLFGDDGLKAMGILDSLGNLNIDDMSLEVFKTMYNPFQYIASCTWFPVAYSNIVGDAVSTIQIGWWNYNLSGKQLSQNVGSFFDSVEQLPVHPQSATRGKYLNYAPYRKMTMYGKFGSLPIDTSFLEIGNYIVNNYLVDYVSGECLFQVFVSDNSAGTGRKLVAKTQFLIGVPIQLAQIGRDYLGTAVSAIDTAKSAIGGAVAGFAVGGVAGAKVGAVISSAHGIYDTINTSMPQLETSGANGSFICSELSTTMTIINFRVVEENIDHKGRPLCQHRVLNTLTGFIQCAEGDVNIPCLMEEKNRIGDFLVSGFFWE